MVKEFFTTNLWTFVFGVLTQIIVNLLLIILINKTYKTFKTFFVLLVLSVLFF